MNVNSIEGNFFPFILAGAAPVERLLFRNTGRSPAPDTVFFLSCLLLIYNSCLQYDERRETQNILEDVDKMLSEVIIEYIGTDH